MAMLSKTREGHKRQWWFLSWTNEYYYYRITCCFQPVLGVQHPRSSLRLTMLCMFNCPVCGHPDARLLFSSLLSSSSSFSPYTAEMALICLVWSSQMEPEHDLFPGETVCFLCPACTKSHVVPLPVSHADSPLQVLGYLADGGSDFRSSFFFIFDRQPGV